MFSEVKKTILITGSTDGIGFEAARKLVGLGHRVLLHGRNEQKLAKAAQALSEELGQGPMETYLADLSSMSEVEALAREVASKHDQLDVLINNAGVLKTREATTPDGLDVRFVVNTIAPYLLTRRLLPLLGSAGRVINLSSAAQAPVSLAALAGQIPRLGDNAAYAQSKLALTMWSGNLARSLEKGGPVIVSVNPGSLLATKMVNEAYGVAGADIGIGANILVRAALDDEFAAATGRYFDNDSGDFALPHPYALNGQKSADLVRVLDELLIDMGSGESQRMSL